MFSEGLFERAVNFIPVLLSLTVHEWAHAWTAWKLGDDTAKMLGRVSLNPIDHIDPVGTLLLPLLGVPFGWAKPVPFNPVRFHSNINMSLGTLLVAAAGPISNLLLAAVGIVGLVALNKLGGGNISPQAYAIALQLGYIWVLINILLACFNLLPIPPLDGSRIVDAIVPSALRPVWNQFSAIGPFVLLAVLVLPNLVGFSLLALPSELATNLVGWVMGW